MNVVTNRWVGWLLAQTRLTRYAVSAVLLHLALLIAIGSIKFVHDLTQPAPPKEIHWGNLSAVPGEPAADDSGATTRAGGAGRPGDADRAPTSGGRSPATATRWPTASLTGTIPVPGAALTQALTLEPPGRVAWTPTGSTGPQFGLGVPPGMQQRPGLRGIRDVGPPGTIKTEETPATERAVVAALRWLQANQKPDGSWSCHTSDAAGTGLALLAFLGHGETVDSREFGETVDRALKYLVRTLRDDGLVPGGNLYAQSLVTLALAEAHSLTPSPYLVEPLERAVQHLVRAQQVPKTNPLHTGGWRYTLTAADADLSVTGWVIMALKSARLAGVAVPDETFAAAERFVWAMHGGDGFGYSSPTPTPVMSAVGAVCLQFLERGDDRRVRAAMDTFRNTLVSWEQTAGEFVLYGWYYMTQAIFHHDADAARAWNARLSAELVAWQRGDGSWPVPPRSRFETEQLAASPVYATALGALILEVYYRHLPLYRMPQKPKALETPQTYAWAE